MGEEWVDSAHAAAVLGVGINHVGWLGARGHLVVEHRDGRRFVSQSSLDVLVDERARWVTLPEAGRMLGCSGKTVQRMAGQGRLTQRDTTGNRQPSIERASVELYLKQPPSRRPHQNPARR